MLYCAFINASAVYTANDLLAAKYCTTDGSTDPSSNVAVYTSVTEQLAGVYVNASWVTSMAVVFAEYVVLAMTGTCVHAREYVQ